MKALHISKKGRCYFSRWIKAVGTVAIFASFAHLSFGQSWNALVTTGTDEFPVGPGTTTTFKKLTVPAFGATAFAWNSNRVFFLGTLQKLKSGEVGSGNDTGIFMVPAGGGEISAIVREGDDAPGVTGAKFRKFSAPVAGGEEWAEWEWHGEEWAEWEWQLGSWGIAFIGNLDAAPGVDSSNDTGIWLYNLWWYGEDPPTSNSYLVARENGDAPDASGEGVVGKFKKFESLAVMTVGEGDAMPLFVARLHTEGTVTNDNDRGLWIWDAGLEATRLLLREGDVLDGKTVKSFSVLPRVSGVFGQTRSFSANYVVAAVTFTDKTTSIMVLDLFGTPEV